MSLYPQEIAHLVERLDGTAPDRTHWGFLLGLDAYRRGDPECPFLAHSIAAIQFHHGWQEAEEDARRADHQFDVQFEANYCWDAHDES